MEHPVSNLCVYEHTTTSLIPMLPCCQNRNMSWHTNCWKWCWCGALSYCIDDSYGHTSVRYCHMTAAEPHLAKPFYMRFYIFMI